VSTRNRLAIGYVLVVLSVVFVFAIWPLHLRGTAGPDVHFGPSNCGSALAPAMLNGTQKCPDVVRHRRDLLLELGVAALLVGLFAIMVLIPSRASKAAQQRQRRARTVAELDRLVDLHKQGMLTDEEFAAAKAKLLV